MSFEWLELHETDDRLSLLQRGRTGEMLYARLYYIALTARLNARVSLSLESRRKKTSNLLLPWDGTQRRKPVRIFPDRLTRNDDPELMLLSHPRLRLTPRTDMEAVRKVH